MRRTPSGIDQRSPASITMNRNDANEHGPLPPESEASAVTLVGLRERAEQDQRLRAHGPTQTLTLDGAERLVHELTVHQIELELQNEDLRCAQAELERSRARYFELYDLAPVGYLTLNEAGQIEEANLAAATLLGQTRNALVGQPLSRFIHREDEHIYFGLGRRLESTLQSQRCELRLANSSDLETWVLMETCLAPESPADRQRRRSILLDITARKRGEQALLDAQARLRLVTEIAGLTFWEWDPKTDRLSVPSDRTLTSPPDAGSTPTRLDTWAQMLHPDDRPRLLAAIRGFVADPGDSREIEYRIRQTETGYIWLTTRLVAIRASNGQLDRLLLVHQDVTGRKASEDRALQLAKHDPLTGLPSRSLLEQLAAPMLASARRSGQQAAVLFLDLDRFKDINDLHGHDVGDEVLKQVAKRLRASFRAEDLVCRLGGDEFVVVLANVRTDDDAAHAARKAISTLTPPYEIAGNALQCVASIGISLFPRDGATLGKLMREADLAMYQAKTMRADHYRFATQALDR
jgi:diguanylate cyclase (GGDEF)-like protein/PAS domain S-box-containing protein